MVSIPSLALSHLQQVWVGAAHSARHSCLPSPSHALSKPRLCPCPGGDGELSLWLSVNAGMGFVAQRGCNSCSSEFKTGSSVSCPASC